MSQPSVDEIIREGGQFWVIYVASLASPTEWRPVTRETVKDAAKSELAWYRDRDTLAVLTYKVKHVVVTVEELDW